jgi:hypothetical protein
MHEAASWPCSEIQLWLIPYGSSRPLDLADLGETTKSNIPT